MVEKGQHVDRVHAARYIPSQLQWSLNYNVVLPEHLSLPISGS